MMGRPKNLPGVCERIVRLLQSEGWHVTGEVNSHVIMHRLSGSVNLVLTLRKTDGQIQSARARIMEGGKP